MNHAILQDTPRRPPSKLIIQDNSASVSISQTAVFLKEKEAMKSTDTTWLSNFYLIFKTSSKDMPNKI